MFLDEDHLTVYNGVEDRSLSGDRCVHLDLCCVSDKSDGEPECPFKLKCTDNMKLIHRHLLLGEPLSQSLLDNMGFKDARVFNDWSPSVISSILNRSLELIETIEEESFLGKKIEREDDDFYMAVLLVKLFVQLNYTGPDLVSNELSSFETSCKRSEVDGAIRSYFEVDGIELDSTVRAPALLLIANYFLSSLQNDSLLGPFFLMWKFRIDYLHQRILNRRSWTLSRQLKYFGDKYIAWSFRHDLSGVMVDVHASFLCEIAEMLVYYYDGILSERFLEEAMRTLGIVVEVSGKMGYRTKFQQTPTPQTTVNVNKTEGFSKLYVPKIDESTFYSSIPNCLPNSENLNDDTRLERIRLVDEVVSETHVGIHQLVLCSALLHKQGFCGKTELDRQEIEALINVIIDNPVSWSGRLSALVARCRLEKLDKRAIDRTLRQIEGLTKIISRPAEDSLVLQRQYLFFGAGHPSIADAKLLFGEVLISLEHWKEALRIFTELGSFEHVVTCYEMMNLRHKAEELVKAKIESEGKTPKLLILLGDVSSDISYYEEAWDLSGNKSYWSQFKLGNHYFKRNEFEKSAVYLNRAVELAPLEYPCWLKLAWACYKTENYETAFQAYLRAANLEYDNFQVWNNLANCALKLDRKEYALRAYKLAVKCNYDEWRVWSNILVVSSELRNIADAIIAYHRILDLNKSFSDEAVLDILVDIAIDGDNPDITIMNNLAKLMGRITSLGSRSFIVWLLYGRLLSAFMRCDSSACDDDLKGSNYERGMLYYDKSLTLMRQNPNWKTDLTTLTNVINCIGEYRGRRDEGLSKMNSDVNGRLKGLDAMLKQTAKSVYDNLKVLMETLPNPEKITPAFNEIAEELKNPFYV